MPQIDLVLRSRRVVTPDGVVPAAVGVRGGRIAAVDDYGAPLSGREETDLGEVALLPGAVDLDAAVQAPGQALRAGYARTAAAAARGGVTTVAVAPAPARPAVTGIDALRAHMEAAPAPGAGPTMVFLGAITARSTPADLADLRAAGVVGFCCSLSDGGAPDVAGIGEEDLRKAMAELAAMEVPLLVHAEDPGELPERGSSDPRVASRPPRAERRGLERVIAAARVTGTRTHVSPFTAAECAAILAAARGMGIAVSAQTCPHYLCLSAEGVPTSSPALRCRPPLRSGANRTALWTALLAGGADAPVAGAHGHADAVITTIGSGHRPGTGVEAMSWTLPALWTAASRRGRGLADLVRWTSAAPAELVGLRWKGGVAPGYDADLVAFDPEAEQTVPADDPGPYTGHRLTGRVVRTWVAGRDVLSDLSDAKPATPARAAGPDGSTLPAQT